MIGGGGSRFLGLGRVRSGGWMRGGGGGGFLELERWGGPDPVGAAEFGRPPCRCLQALEGRSGSGLVVEMSLWLLLVGFFR